jgi:hypothetical protein
MTKGPSVPQHQGKGIPKSLQEAGEEFYMWMGYCIGGWATVETMVFRICWKTLGCKEEKAAIVYFKSPTLESRVTLVQELVESVLPKTQNGKKIHPDLQTWKDIVLHFNDLKHVRSRIAHHPVAPIIIVGNVLGQSLNTATPGAHVDIFWFQNYVSPEERLRGRHDTVKPLGIDDLKAHHIETLSLTTELNDFLYKRLPAYL